MPATPRLALAFTVLAVAGCNLPNGTGRSPLADEVDVTLVGTVLAADGTAFAHAKVALEKDAPEQRDRDNGTARVELATDADGAYKHTVRGHQTKNAHGEAHFYKLVASRPTGQRAARKFQFRALDVRLPPLRLWNGLQPLQAADGGATATWAAAPDTTDRYNLVVSRGGRAVWTATSIGPVAIALPGYRFDASVPYDVSVTAFQPDLELTADTGTFTAAADATRRVLPIAAVADDRGTAYPGLFDGDLVGAAFMHADAKSASGEGKPKELVIDLGAPKPVARLVVYGAAGVGGDVQLATTPSDWGPRVAKVEADHADVDLGGMTARYVRLLPSEPTTFLGHMAEVRVVGP